MHYIREVKTPGRPTFIPSASSPTSSGHLDQRPRMARLSQRKKKVLAAIIAALSLGTLLPTNAAAVSMAQLVLDRDAQIITIEGSGFGSGPNVVLFDNFSSGDKTLVSTDSPLIGQWIQLTGTGTPYKHSDAFSGSASARIIWDGEGRYGFNWGLPDSAAPNGMKLFQEVYYSFAVKDLGNFPGDGGTETTFSTRSSTKDSWIMLANRGDRGQHEPDERWLGNDIYIPAWSGSGFLLGSNSGGMLGGSWWQGNLTRNWAFSDWNQFYFFAAANPENPRADGFSLFGHLNRHMHHTSYRQAPIFGNELKEPYWDRIKFAPWYSLGNGGVKRLMDEVYIAVGPNAAARVLIGDNEDIGKVTRLHHAIPISWNENVVRADISALSLPSDREWFVYLFNSSHAHNATGFPLEGCPGCPVPPEIHEVE